MKRAVVVDPRARSVTIVIKDWSLGELQEAVGGRLATIHRGALLYWINEENIPSVLFHGIVILGAIVITGAPTDDGDFEGLTKGEANELIEYFIKEVKWESGDGR